MDQGIANLATGLAQGLNSYLGQNIQQQRQQENVAFQQQQMQQTHTAEAQSDIDIAGKVTPDMAESLMPGMGGNWVTQFQGANKRWPTIDEAKSGLNDVIEKLDAVKGKAEKANVQHYLGNTPDGKAIFGDNNGNMITPDKQPYSGVVLPKSSTMPTAQARSTGEFAATIRPHITEMRDMIQEADKKGYIGPAAGRIYGQFLTGKVGSTGDPEADRLLGKLRAMDSLLKTGAMKVHFGSRGGQNMYEHFSDMLNSGKQSAAVLNGALDTMDSFMMGYQQAGQPQGVSTPKTGANNDPLGIR